MVGVRMQQKSLLVALLFVAAGYTAWCDEKNEKQEKKKEATTEAVKEFLDAAQEAKDLAFKHKAETIAEMKEKVAAINKEIDTLSQNDEQASDATKAETTLKKLRAQAAELSKRIVELTAKNESK